MSRFRKRSYAIWPCQYPLVWTPRYRFRTLSGPVAEEVSRGIRTFSEQFTCEAVELNVQIVPCTPVGDDSAKDFGIGLCRDGEGSNGDSSLQPVSAFET